MSAESERLIAELVREYAPRQQFLRDADGDAFFGFCGARVYVPDDDGPGIADAFLARLRERLKAAP